LERQADENQANALIYTMGEEVEDILTLHFRPAEVSEYDMVKDRLDAHFVVLGNVIFDRN